jgi:hypothetical protein
MLRSPLDSGSDRIPACGSGSRHSEKRQTRLADAIRQGFRTPADKLAGRAEAIWAARRQELAQADARRRAKAKAKAQEKEFARLRSAELH